MEAILSGHARHGILGSGLFDDYCHMTLAGNRIVAFEIARRLQVDMDLGTRALALEDVRLEPFVEAQRQQLRRLYQVKKLRWLAVRWLDAHTPVDAINFQGEADHYSEQMKTIDGRMDMLREKRPPPGPAAP